MTARVTIDVRLSRDDGTFALPGECEPASAHMSILRNNRTTIELGGVGSVCGRRTDQTYVVTHVFTGRHDIIEAKRK